MAKSIVSQKDVLNDIVASLQKSELYGALQDRQTPEVISEIVDSESRRLLMDHTYEEESYAQRMLLENPVIMDRRPISNTSDNPLNSSDDQATVNLKQKRAEACRKSRLNGKVKKAKLKHRLDYLQAKLPASLDLLKFIHEVIGKYERQLQDAGHDFRQLRGTFDIRPIDEVVQHYNDLNSGVVQNSNGDTDTTTTADDTESLANSVFYGRRTSSPQTTSICTTSDFYEDGMPPSPASVFTFSENLSHISPGSPQVYSPFYAGQRTPPYHHNCEEIIEVD